MRYVLVIATLFLAGCPMEDETNHCERVMKCETQREMNCEKHDSGCGEVCHYHVVEDCWEDCK
jgi:hypothetical protein